VAFFAAELANPQNLWEKLLAFLTDFEAMFPGFNGVALNAQKPFFLIAFVMVVYHLVQRLSGPGSKESQMRAIGSAMVLAASIALSNSGAKLVQTGFTTIQTDMGAGNSAPDLVEAKKEELIVAMTVGVEEKAATATGDSRGALYYLTHWGDAIDKGIDSLVPSIGGLIIQVASFFLIFWAKLASLIAWGFWLIQQFLFTFSLIFLPAMIAMIGIGSLRSIGTRYVMSVVGLLSWPMGWGLVNVGTEAMLTSAVKTVKAAPAADWEITTYLWAIATVSIIPFWMIFGYAFVPFVIQRMVTSGANAASGLIGQTAGAAIGAGAAIATGGASLAAGAAAGAGGGGSASGATASSGGGSAGTGLGGGGSSGGASGAAGSGLSSGGGGGQSGGGSSGGTTGGGESPAGGSGDGGSSLAASAGAIAAAAAMAQGPFDELAKESGNPAPANMTPSSSAAREAVKRKQQARAARPSPSTGPIGAARTA
jgi:hypothetical protein